MTYSLRRQWKSWTDKLLSRFWRRRRKDAALVDTPTADHRILLIAPVVDQLTGMMARWLVEVRTQLHNVMELVGSDVSYHQLASVLQQMPSPAIIIFYGHGQADSLLTNAALGLTRTDDTSSLGTLCLAESFGSAADISLIAFSCSAAKRLGPDFCSMGSNRGFVGFISEIGFVYGNSKREAAFKKPMNQLTLAVARAGRVTDEDVASTKAAYQVERERWRPGGEFATDTRAPFVVFFLGEQLRALRKF